MSSSSQTVPWAEQGEERALSGVLADASSEQSYGPAGRSLWMDVDWREHQRWVNIDGQPVNTIQLGPLGSGLGTARQPLVFVHGLAGSWPNWLEQLLVFAAEHCVIALDLPGFGHSPMPNWKISISRYAGLLDKLLDVLGFERAAIIGNSMGGLISAELAIAFPQRVERLVLVSPAGVSTYRPAAAMRALPWLRRAEPLLTAYGTWISEHADDVAARRALRGRAFAVVASHPSRLPPPLVAESLRGSGTPGFVDALEATVCEPIRERLGQIACPTLVVWGDRDPLITVRDADVFAELIPGARKIIFSDTGHVSMLERPAAFNELLRGFLAD